MLAPLKGACVDASVTFPLISAKLPAEALTCMEIIRISTQKMCMCFITVLDRLKDIKRHADAFQRLKLNAHSEGGHIIQKDRPPDKKIKQKGADRGVQ